MALLSFRGFDTPSLLAQGEQRLPPIFNSARDIPVGESGSGKSVTALSILGLLPQPAGRIVGGRVIFDGLNLVGLNEHKMLEVRGRRIGLVLQDPMVSLNPVLTVGTQIIEVLRFHLGLRRAVARERAIELLGQVGIPYARQRVDDYPHQFSGGMRQRAMIAMAIACHPELLIADEPTTALDVTIQAEIIELISELRRKLGMAVIWITHDLASIASFADRALILYAGRVVEEGLIPLTQVRLYVVYRVAGLVWSPGRIADGQGAFAFPIPESIF